MKVSDINKIINPTSHGLTPSVTAVGISSVAKMTTVALMGKAKRVMKRVADSTRMNKLKSFAIKVLSQVNCPVTPMSSLAYFMDATMPIIPPRKTNKLQSILLQLIAFFQKSEHQQ